MAIEKRIRITGEENITPLSRRVKNEIQQLGNEFDELSRKIASAPEMRLSSEAQQGAQQSKFKQGDQSRIGQESINDSFGRISSSLENLIELLDEKNKVEFEGHQQDARNLKERLIDKQREYERDRLIGANKKRASLDELSEEEKLTKHLQAQRNYRTEDDSNLRSLQTGASFVNQGIAQVGAVMTSAAIGGLVHSIFSSTGGIMAATGGVVGGRVGSLFRKEERYIDPETGEERSRTRSGEVAGSVIGGIVGTWSAGLARVFGGIASRGVEEALDVDSTQKQLYAITGKGYDIRAAQDQYANRRLAELNQKNAEEFRKDQLNLQKDNIKSIKDEQQYFQDPIQGQYRRFTGTTDNASAYGSDIIRENTYSTERAANETIVKERAAKRQQEAEEEARRLQRMTAFSTYGMKESDAYRLMAQQATTSTMSDDLMSRALQTLQVSKAYGIDTSTLLEGETTRRFASSSSEESAAVNFDRMRIILDRMLTETTGQRLDTARLVGLFRVNNQITAQQLAVGETTSSTTATAIQAAFMEAGGAGSRFQDPQAAMQMMSAMDQTIKGSGNQFVDAYVMRSIQQVGREQGEQFSFADVRDIQSKGLFGLTDGKALGVDTLQTMLQGMGGESFETKRNMMRAMFGNQIDADKQMRLAKGDFSPIGELRDKALMRGQDVTTLSATTVARAGAATGTREQFSASMADTLAHEVGKPLMKALEPALQPFIEITGKASGALADLAANAIEVGLKFMPGISKNSTK